MGLEKELEDKIDEHRDELYNISEFRKRYYSSINKYQLKMMDNELENIVRTRYLDGSTGIDIKNYPKEIGNNSSKLLQLSVSSLKRIEEKYVPEMEHQLKVQVSELENMLKLINKPRDISC